jgi:hypothetical protein
MSRPQFHQNQSQITTAHPVVNGGLIDFQENYNRTMCEYPTPQQLMTAAVAAGYHPGYHHPAMAQAATVAASQGLPGVGQHYPVAGASGFVSQPVPATATSIPQNPVVGPLGVSPGTAVPAPGTYISGPPTFLHAYGQMYKPVDEALPANGLTTGPNGPKTGLAPGTEGDNSAVQPTTKMLTEQDLHRAIDQRVQSKVESYLNTRRHSPGASNVRSNPSPSVPRARQTCTSAEERSVHRDYISSRQSGLSAEERAAMRVQNVNATMRGGGSYNRSSTRETGHISRDW